MITNNIDRESINILNHIATTMIWYLIITCRVQTEFGKRL